MGDIFSVHIFASVAYVCFPSYFLVLFIFEVLVTSALNGMCSQQ